MPEEATLQGLTHAGLMEVRVCATAAITAASCVSSRHIACKSDSASSFFLRSSLLPASVSALSLLHAPKACG